MEKLLKAVPKKAGNTLTSRIQKLMTDFRFEAELEGVEEEQEEIQT